MKRRTHLTTALAVGSVLALAACGGGGDDGDAGGGTTLTFLSWDGEETMRPVLEAFEESHPDITVRGLVLAAGRRVHPDAADPRAVRHAPDVFLIAAENKTNLIDGEHVLDLAGEPFIANVPSSTRRPTAGTARVRAVHQRRGARDHVQQGAARAGRR